MTTTTPAPTAAEASATPTTNSTISITGSENLPSTITGGEEAVAASDDVDVVVANSVGNDDLVAKPASPCRENNKLVMKGDDKDDDKAFDVEIASDPLLPLKGDSAAPSAVANDEMQQEEQHEQKSQQPRLPQVAGAETRNVETAEESAATTESTAEAAPTESTAEAAPTESINNPATHNLAASTAMAGRSRSTSPISIASSADVSYDSNKSSRNSDSSGNGNHNNNNDNVEDEEGDDIEGDDDEADHDEQSADTAAKTTLKTAPPTQEQHQQPASSKLSSVDNDGLHMPRDATTLGILAKKFLEYMKHSTTGVVDLTDLTRVLKAPKRRIYDITNVLEGVGLIKKCSKNVFVWKGPLSNGDENGKPHEKSHNNILFPKDDDDDVDEDDMNDDGDDDGDNQTSKMVSRVVNLRDKVQSYYQEETLLDTWISRLRRVLLTQTNLGCSASDIVNAMFHPKVKTTTTSTRDAAADPATSKQFAKASSMTTLMSRSPALIHPSNLLDETGKVQWSLVAIYAPHGSLLQVASNSTSNTGSRLRQMAPRKCRLYISTKPQSAPTDEEIFSFHDEDDESDDDIDDRQCNDHIDVDDDDELPTTAQQPEEISQETPTHPNFATSSSTTNSPNNMVGTSTHGREAQDESNSPTHSLRNGETNPVNCPIDVDKRDSNTCSDPVHRKRNHDHHRGSRAAKRRRRPDPDDHDNNKQIEIFLLPTSYSLETSTVRLDPRGVKSIPDPLPPVYASATAASTNPVTSGKSSNHQQQQQPNRWTPTFSKNHNNSSAFSVEDFQSWNFVSQLTHQEGISDFFGEPPPMGK